MEPRDHHYFFAHTYLKHLVFENPEFIFCSLRSRKGKDMLLNLWYQVPKVLKQESTEMKILLPNGLDHSFHQLEKSTLLLIQMPAPASMPEAYFVGIVFPEDNDNIRYFTLEYSIPYDSEQQSDNSGTAVMCEWKENNHFNYGIFINSPTKEDFIHYVSAISVNSLEMN